MAVLLPRIPKSKWRKHILLQEDALIGARLPETRPYSMQTAIACVKEYGAVVIKPEWSEGGNRVCKFAQEETGYSLTFDRERHLFAHARELAAHLPAWSATRSCIVQRYIRLAPYGRRPADIRTIVQKSPTGAFEVSGAFVKVAPQGRFVTNVKQGGRVISLGTYLQRAFPDISSQSDVHRTLYALSEQIGRHLGQHFSNRVYGIDIGADENGGIWIIEVNTEPSLDILRLVDRRMHRRAKELQRYHRSKHPHWPTRIGRTQTGPHYPVEGAILHEQTERRGR